MAFSDQDVQSCDDFLKLFCEAQWDKVNPEKAIQIYKAIAWLQRMTDSIKVQQKEAIQQYENILKETE